MQQHFGFVQDLVYVFAYKTPTKCHSHKQKAFHNTQKKDDKTTGKLSTPLRSEQNGSTKKLKRPWNDILLRC